MPKPETTQSIQHLHVSPLPDTQSLEIAQRDAAAKSLPELKKDILKLHAAATRSACTAVRDAILAGVQLLEAKQRIRHGHWSKWLAENFSAQTQLSQRTAQRYVNAAKKYLALDDDSKAKLSLENLSLTNALDGPDDPNKTRSTSADILPIVHGNEWLTPKSIVAASLALLGTIDLDPAAEPAASHVPAKVHITAAENALRPDASWQGRVFLNPGCKGALLPWVETLLAAYNAKQVTQALLVLPAAGQHSFRPSLHSFPAAFAREQLTVSLPDSEQLALLKQPLMFVYVAQRPNVELFAKHFSAFSDIYVPFSSQESSK